MKLVVALGGNALGNTPQEQQTIVKETAKALLDLIQDGHQLVLVHGNGPQVGMIHLGFEVAHEANSKIPPMPFPECGAMSQGYIGYHLQQALQNELIQRQLERPVVTLVTQVQVDAHDPAFQHPTKPVGPFYSLEQAQRLQTEQGYVMIEDSGRGYRRVVPSPKPQTIVEREIILSLLQQGALLIAAGGGGIPVVKTEQGFHGVAAVIDKDLASETMAELIDADGLIILTAVPQVAIHFGTPQQEFLKELSVAQAERYCEEGHFAPGSMLPKVQAAIAFAKSGPNRFAIIGSLEKAAAAVRGESGTTIRFA
ncbi:MAG: carbamate kinase [Bacilli bacterium]|jgi:carbamate kinase